MFGKLRARWRLAGMLERAERNGQSIITVPFELVAQVKADIWARQMAQASVRWTERIAEVSLEDWQAAVRKAADERSESGS